MITENYIKMCEQAEELQKWYKSDVKNVREGDRYICRCDTCKEAMFVNYVKDSDIDYINERDMTDVDPTYAAMVSLSGVGEFGAFWDDGGFIYLPTQERLWDMLEGTVLEKLDNFIANLTITIYETLQEHLLNHVMEHNWGKMWHNEKWEAI